MSSILDALLSRLQQSSLQAGQADIGMVPGMSQPAPVQQPILQQAPPPPPPMDVGMERRQFVQNQGAQGMAPLPPMGIPSQPTNPQQGGGGINWQMLMDIGIPALSALVGTAAPGTLAGAAGLSTGYTGQREKYREREFELKKEEAKRQTEAQEIAKPTFGQQNKIQALKTGLRSGKVVVGREFGEPQTYPGDREKMNLETAVLSIQDSGFDPALFEQELEPYANAYAQEYESIKDSKNPKDEERAKYLYNLLLSLPFVNLTEE